MSGVNFFYEPIPFPLLSSTKPLLLHTLIRMAQDMLKAIESRLTVLKNYMDSVGGKFARQNIWRVHGGFNRLNK